jgi:hypothetical protein
VIYFFLGLTCFAPAWYHGPGFPTNREISMQ